MEEKTTRTRKQRSLSKDAPLGETFTNRIKGLEAVFDDNFDLTQTADSKSGSASPASPAIKKSNKKTPNQKK